MRILGYEVKNALNEASQLARQEAERAVQGKIRDVVENPTKNIEDLQKESPLGQFVNVKA